MYDQIKELRSEGVACDVIAETLGLEPGFVQLACEQMGWNVVEPS
jgi:hypothetical protein